MKTPLQAIYLGGKIKRVLTSVVLVNNVAKTLNVDVPANKRWLLISIRQVNADDVDRFCSVSLIDPTNTILIILSSTLTAGGGDHQMPNATIDVDAVNYIEGLILKAGDRLQGYWAAGGASTGATDADGYVINVIEYDM